MGALVVQVLVRKCTQYALQAGVTFGRAASEQANDLIGAGVQDISLPVQEIDQAVRTTQSVCQACPADRAPEPCTAQCTASHLVSSAQPKIYGHPVDW